MLEPGALPHQQLTRLRGLLLSVVNQTLQTTQNTESTMNDSRILVLHPYRTRFDLDDLRTGLTDQLNRTAPAHVNITVVLARDAIKRADGHNHTLDDFPSIVTDVDDNGVPHYQRFFVPVDHDGPVFIGKTTADIVHRAWRYQNIYLVNVKTLKIQRVAARSYTAGTDRARWAKLIPEEPNADRAQLESLNAALPCGGSND